MKTILVFASGIVLMVVMYFYFIAVCVYALIALPFKKLFEVIMSSDKINHLAGI